MQTNPSSTNNGEIVFSSEYKNYRSQYRNCHVTFLKDPSYFNNKWSFFVEPNF